MIKLPRELALGSFGRPHLQKGNWGYPGRFDLEVFPDQVVDQVLTDPILLSPGVDVASHIIQVVHHRQCFCGGFL